MSSGRVIEVIIIPGENPEIFDWTNIKPAPNRGLPTSPEPEPKPNK